MSKPADLVQKELEEIKMQTQKQAEEVQDVYNPFMTKHLETFGADVNDASMGEYQNEVIRKQLAMYAQVNGAVKNKLHDENPPLLAQKTATVNNPPAQQPVAKESYKQRRERNKKIKEARKLSPVGDEYTLETVKNLENYSNKKDISKEDMAKGNAIKADLRSLRIYIKGYDKDKKGNPRTEEDMENKELDRQFLDDYLTGDKELRRPHLERITNEMLAMKFPPDLFKRENFAKNAALIKEMGDKIVYFENLKKENKEFFDELPEVQKNIFQSMEPTYMAFIVNLSHQFNARGINLDAHTIYKGKNRELIDMGLSMKDAADDEYKRAIEETATRKQVNVSNEVDMLANISKVENTKNNKAMEDHYREKEGIEFEGPVTNFQYEDIIKYKKMMVNNPEAYLENKEVVDKVYQEFYKSMLLLGDINFTMRGLQSVTDTYSSSYNSSENYMPRMLVNTAISKQEKLQDKLSICTARCNNLTQVLKHFLKGEKMNSYGEATLAEFSQTQADSQSM